MAWLRAVAGFQVFRGGRFWVFGDTDMRTDLLDGFSALPIWMQELLRPLVVPDSDERVRAGTTSQGKPKRTGRS
jgi:hypothetical protein